MNGPLHVLIVEDNPGDIDLTRAMLPESGPVSFDIETASRLSEAVASVRSRPVDLVLLDLGLPDSQGPGTFTAMNEAAPETPIIVLTSNDDQAVAIRAVREGAQDYLIKGQLVGNLLVRATLYAIERKEMEAACRRQTEELHSRNDELTRFNRVMVGRELRMIELKQEVNALCDRVGEAPAYAIGAIEDGDASSRGKPTGRTR